MNALEPYPTSSPVQPQRSAFCDGMQSNFLRLSQSHFRGQTHFKRTSEALSVDPLRELPMYGNYTSVKERAHILYRF